MKATNKKYVEVQAKKKKNQKKKSGEDTVLVRKSIIFVESIIWTYVLELVGWQL